MCSLLEVPGSHVTGCVSSHWVTSVRQVHSCTVGCHHRAGVGTKVLKIPRTPGTKMPRRLWYRRFAWCSLGFRATRPTNWPRKATVQNCPPQSRLGAKRGSPSSVSSMRRCAGRRTESTAIGSAAARNSSKLKTMRLAQPSATAALFAFFGAFS